MDHTGTSSIDPQVKLKPAVFLDRDGTINREVNYLSDPKDFELLPGVAATIARWNVQGWAVVLVTNQSGVGRGYFTLKVVDAVHALMRKQLDQEGARLDGIYVCPHHPDAKCLCRKPATQLFKTAADELRLNLARSYFIGDKLSDLLPADQFGARAILVRTGHGKHHVGNVSQAPMRSIVIVDDLPAAAIWMEAARHENKAS